MSDWTWLSYVAFASCFGRGDWFARLQECSWPWPLLPLLHEEAERILGPDYITGDVIGGVEGAWASPALLERMAYLQSLEERWNYAYALAAVRVQDD